MELFYYPGPCRERRPADDGYAAITAIGVVRLECGHSLIRADQGRSLSRKDHGRLIAALSATKASTTRTRAVATKSRDGGGMAFSVAITITLSFATAMVVSHLPASYHVETSASCPLNSASATISAYNQYSTVSSPLVPLFLFTSVCWLVVALPLFVPPSPCITCCRTAPLTSILDPPLFSHCLPCHPCHPCHPVVILFVVLIVVLVIVTIGIGRRTAVQQQ